MTFTRCLARHRAHGAARYGSPLALFLGALAFVAVGPTTLHAQDAFEVQVYEYATVPKGMWNLETHLNYTARGSKVAVGQLYPTQGQVHLTFELTRGLTDDFELAAYLVTARHEGGPFGEIVGYRVRPRAKVPESWNWPVGVSLSLEVGFPDAHYEENATTLEVRPIIEKQFGAWQVDLNPVIGRALKGPGTSDGWDFEPNARIAYSVSSKLDLSLEYYGSTGNVTNWLPRDQQVHQFYPGFDYQFDDARVVNVGIGWAGTSAGDGLVVKMRYGVLFGGS